MPCRRRPGDAVPRKVGSTLRESVGFTPGHGRGLAGGTWRDTAERVGVTACYYARNQRSAASDTSKSDTAGERMDQQSSGAPLAIGDLVRRYREIAGLSQEALAERAGMSPRGLLYLERGLRRPYPATLNRLADALALTTEERRIFM